MAAISQIRKDMIVPASGQQSAVLSRKAGDDRQQGWSITTRPYRPEPTDALLEDLGSSSSDNCCCILPGNRILMADGSTLPVEQIQPGMAIAGMSGNTVVRDVKRTTLGYTRKAIELRGPGDDCLIMTDDHPLWVVRHGQEWWGSYNVHHVMYEMNNTVGFELDRLPIALHFDLPQQVAHVSGWLPVRPIYHHLDPSTEVFHLVTEEGFSFIAEGFPLFSHALNAQGPSAPWQGLAQRAAESIG